MDWLECKKETTLTWMFLTENGNSLYLFNFIVITILYWGFVFWKKKNRFAFIIVFIHSHTDLCTSVFFHQSSMHTAFNVFVTALFFSLNPIFGHYLVRSNIIRIAISKLFSKDTSKKKSLWEHLSEQWFLWLSYIFNIQTFLYLKFFHL